MIFSVLLLMCLICSVSVLIFCRIWNVLNGEIVVFMLCSGIMWVWLIYVVGLNVLV